MKRLMVAALAAFGTWAAAGAAEAEKPAIKAVLVHLGANMWCDWYPEGTDLGKVGKFPPDTQLGTRDDLWREVIDHAAAKGLNMVVIDIGEGLVYPSHPELAIRGSWPAAKLRAEVERIRSLGLEPIPKLNFSTSHNGWLKHYRRIVSTPAYYKVCEDVLADVHEVFGHPRFIHIGCDEETAHHQCAGGQFQYVSVRLGDAWWCDFLHLVKTVERLGARAWAWSDYGWAHPEEFVARCPKSVVLSNWFYDEGDGGFDIGANAAPDRVRLSNFYLLKKAGYDQIPCASNYIGWKRREHGKGADDVIGRTVELGRRDLDNGHLLGFMMASWQVSRNRKRADCTLHGIDLMADALEGRIADPGTCDPKAEDY